MTLESVEVERKLSALRAALDSTGCRYAILAHETTLHSAEDGVASGMGRLEEMAPTFILKTEGGFLAAIVSGATKLSYRKLRKTLGFSNVALAARETVLELTGSPVGTVSLVQTTIPTILDERLAALGEGYGGCGVPGHTLRIHIADLIRITRARVFDFTEPKE
jgi:prolyl-tRNA editing enzyme YbaK/EbsC (Cys-tRNA(Pro) deacylase)